MIATCAIPTEYRGTRFRSRLEARWACFFDNCGWPWEYEPIDLNGYIPDFILTFSEPVLVEVKPVLYYCEFAQHWPRIKESGWDKEAMILGAKIFQGNSCSWGAIIGEHAQRQDGEWFLGEAVLETCQKCKVISFFNSEHRFSCAVYGCYDGNSFTDPWKHEEARSLFADCGRIVQYATQPP